MSTERRIKGLKTRLKSLLTSFNLIKMFVDEYNEETDACQVPVRLEHLVKLWKEVNAVQVDLETVDEAAVDQYLKVRTDFESTYYRVKGFLLSVNKSPALVQSPSPRSNAQPPLQSSCVRLPDVKLPVFSGQLDSWLNFHDLFVSLVHSSHELSNIQKFYYLRSSLSGDALKLIQTITISADNYQVAWKLLTEHYQNSARLKQSYVDSLFEFPSLKRESATELHSLVEKFEANVRVLKQLGERTEFWDILLIRMLSIRLDNTTRRDWEEFSSTKNQITFTDLTAFIQRRVTVLQSINKTTEPPPSTFTKKPVQRPVTSHGASQQNYRKCLVCSDHHPLYQCAVFSKMSVEDKERDVRRHQLCRNCLRKGHQTRDCPSSSTCRKCRNRHHTQLCPTEAPVAVNSRTADAAQPKVSSIPVCEEQPRSSASAVTEPVSCSSSTLKEKSVLLATAVVVLVDDNGTNHVARALLDSGSECCFMTESLAQQMKAKRTKIHVPIAGIGQSSTYARHKLQSTIRSRTCDYSTAVEFLILPKVTVNLPSASVDTSSWEIPPGIQLADPSFYDKRPVQLVLGAEIFFDLFKVSGRIELGESLPNLVNSVLGWVVSGKTTDTRSTNPVIANVATVTDLHRLMERFWTIEEDNASTCYSVEESACEEHFRRTVSRTPEGRYVVSLPIKEDVLSNLGDNRRTAIRRFRLLQGQLAKNDELGNQYRAFMDEYFQLGHMELVPDYQSQHPSYHLPHHAVIRADSTTTKVRVVFDASCRTSNGPSLNDALMVGPIVQEELRSITMRSRIRPILLNADVKQMYRQILTDQRSNNLQHIVWSPSPDSPLQTYELKTVTYGTASAPFLATRVLQQLADDEQHDFPEAAGILRKDFYVDDLFSGADTVEEAITLQKQLESLLGRGGFELRKWASNEEAVLEDVPQDNRALKTSVDLDRDQCIKSLGLHWEPTTDHLRYKIDTPTTDNTPLTKRIALSQIARLFDPLGLVGPVITTAKLFMQALWTLKTNDGLIWGWDQELPTPIKERWLDYMAQLPLLNALRIERFILCPKPSSIQLHFFSDASENAYGACCYIRSSNSTGETKTALLTAKSKVAPLKQQSIPRLELCGALLAAQLYEKVAASLKLATDTYFWVDSTIVICWLNSTPSTWTTFVANRVSKIQLATQNCSWNHVAGQQNPADHISRGLPAEDLLHDALWWKGPQWLALDKECWPIQQPINTADHKSIPDTRKLCATAVPAADNPSFVDLFVTKFSNYNKLLRVTAYCRRFLLHCQRKSRPTTTTITVEEKQQAEVQLIRLVQQQTFAAEWKNLQQSQPVSAKSRIRWFYPFLSTDQLIRIGGRLKHAQQPYDTKHQILLPSSHPLSTLLIRHLHEINLHAAPQLLLNVLRLRYWVTGARSLARMIVQHCVICVKARPKLVQQFMAELPVERITATRPFTITGIDYWGPILLKPLHRRAAPGKAYVAVFVCFSTKAVHLELVGDLSTTKFIQALRRFVARRGLCAEIFSDNGRNFVGANNELQHLVRSNEHHRSITEECANNGIRWRFNPPKASHFGGLWEAAIQSAQKHFVRAAGTMKLGMEDMQTLLAQIECCLNSRPLVPLSDDLTDFEPLSPGHLLTGSSLKAVPDTDVTTIPFNRLRHFQQLQKLLQQFWQRWHIEYLCTLQSRSKWINPPVHIQTGQLVLLKEDNVAPIQWPTARIVDLHPGKDGITRVVTLKTPTGQYTRPVSKIAILPIPPSDIQRTTSNEAEIHPQTFPTKST
ncbi:uncharacterized protein LOC135708976 [Ochlerotatus camptorhynchus]|uniref:uncharacterized protein LOC135708976 n=1 Tax=Ochlerotatus camptorhynchus TaxID=644619 RepID=UPI0031E3ED48